MTETKDSDILVAGIPVKLGRFLKGKKMYDHDAHDPATFPLIHLIF